MEYHIYGMAGDERVITFVGCAKGLQQVPTGAIILQTVSDHAEITWVKWSVRFRRSLKDRKALRNPLADYFRNPSRLKRLLGDEEARQLQVRKNIKFLKFHERNCHVLEEMLANARGEKVAGRTLYSASEQLGHVRWGDTPTDRRGDRFKINSTWAPWYSRAMQMIDSDLIGFFKLKDSLADGLVWIDGRRWAQFASENSDKLRWSEPYEDFSDSDWEYHQ